MKQGGLAGMFEEAPKHKSLGDVIGQLVCLITMLQAPPMNRGEVVESVPGRLDDVWVVFQRWMLPK